jgi:hypothetical protein
MNIQGANKTIKLINIRGLAQYILRKNHNHIAAGYAITTPFIVKNTIANTLMIKPYQIGIINLLKGTGNYGLANVLILIIIIPFFSMAIFIKGIQLKFKNNLL